MNPDTTSAIRDIFIIVAAGLLSVLCLLLIAVILKLYRPISETLRNSAKATGNLSRITGDVSEVSQETSSNIAQTSRNAVEISENLKTGTADLPKVVQSVEEASSGIAAVSDTVTRVARLASRGSQDEANSSGVGWLFHLVRGIFGGSHRGSGDSGAQQ